MINVIGLLRILIAREYANSFRTKGRELTQRQGYKTQDPSRLESNVGPAGYDPTFTGISWVGSRRGIH